MQSTELGCNSLAIRALRRLGVQPCESTIARRVKKTQTAIKHNSILKLFLLQLQLGQAQV
jgi:hypothetical protein